MTKPDIIAVLAAPHACTESNALRFEDKRVDPAVLQLYVL